MAQAPGQDLLALARGFNQLSNARKVGLVVGLAAVVAVAVVLFLYARTPEYRVLFANISERDGGSIVAALSQLNVPYKMAEGGGAILVPADQVYETRLKLAAQGLPKGAGVGFELMEGQKLGTSQFLEQVNYQRAIEGELGRTIASIAAVQSARVHLAIPRPSVFIRESQKPSASVLVTMYPGRTLDAAQVSGIVHLVSSSVPELSARHVTVIDQAGALLTGPSAEGASAVLDAAQLKYLHQVEAAIVQRIENILRPIVGPDNVRAQVAATLDFSQVEQTSETFKPNSSPADQAVRSQQSSESASATPQAPQGVPGALSNQPPGAASAPLVAPPGAQPGAQAPLPPATSSQKEQTVNFEVDKTIRHTKGEVGTIQRLSVAVVVNYRRVVEADAVRMQPLSEQEMAQVTDLVREAMGFNKERGDTVNVVNTPFQAALEAEPGVELPLWKDPENVTLAKDLGKTLLMAIVGLYLFFGVLRPTLRDLVRLGQPLEPVPAGAGAAGGVAVAEGTGAPPPAATGAAEAESGYEVDLAAVREMAKQQPEAVAAMVRKWLAPK